MTSKQASQTDVTQIWLVPDSSTPFWSAFVLMIMLMGAFLYWPIAVIALVALVILIAKWVKRSRAENHELPRG